MRGIIQQQQFRRDYKRQKRRSKKMEKLEHVVEQLVYTGALDRIYRPHRLTGAWNGFWECHIESDWLLIYDISGTEVLLARTGTHADILE